MPKFSPSKNWALEYTVYFGKSGHPWDHYIYVFLGKDGSSLNVFINKDFGISKLFGQGIPNEAGLPNDLVLCAVVEEFEGKRLKIDTFAFEEVSRILKSFL